MDAFSSTDLVTWTNYERIVDTASVKWRGVPCGRRPSWRRTDGTTCPFERIGTILQQDSTVATGAGHHSVPQSPTSSKWYIVYHRRLLRETDRNHRVASIDEMHFDQRGFIKPVTITHEGVLPDPAKRPD